MPIETFLPAFMMVVSLLSSVVLAVKGNYNDAAYWLLAAGLTAVVTFRPF